ncbi:MAG: NADH-quinone oxidoreductase subunit NuoN [Hyphomicrobiaceae bacterium]
MPTLSQLSPIFPELLLALGAMVLLMIGVFRQDDADNGEFVGGLAVGLLVLAGAVIYTQPNATVSLFDEAFLVDRFARFMKLLVIIGSIGALLLSFSYLRQTGALRFEYAVLVLLSTVGMMMMISANGLISLYVGLELQSLALYVLAAFRRDSVRSSEAGLKYFVLGALSSGMLLYGSSLIYGFTGSTSFPVIATVATSTDGVLNIGLIFGLVFLLVGLAFKIAAVPFHMWSPDVYEGAPTPVTAFFAAATKMAAMALLIRVLASAFPNAADQWQQIIVFVAIASMLLGSFAAIGQTNIKRLMAYSSIAHVGFALVGLAANSQEGARGILIYLVIYLVMTLGAFACIIAMRRKDEMIEDINELSGLARTNLPMAVIFAMLMFSLAGIPPLAGFFAKFYVFAAAVKAGLWPLAIIGVLASVVGAFYYLRIVKLMFFDEAREKFLALETYTKVVMYGAAIFVVGFVLWPGPLVEAADFAAKSLRF